MENNERNIRRKDGFRAGTKNIFLWVKVAFLEGFLGAIIAIPILFLLRGSFESFLILILKIALLSIGGFFVSWIGLNYFFKRFVYIKTGFTKINTYFHLRRIFKLTYAPSAGILFVGLLMDLLKYNVYLILSFILIIPGLIAIFFFIKTKKKFVEDYKKI